MSSWRARLESATREELSFVRLWRVKLTDRPALTAGSPAMASSAQEGQTRRPRVISFRSVEEGDSCCEVLSKLDEQRGTLC
ncbi:MAG: hypothetical protein K0Q61_651 [Rhodococcus erythropolis]|jgi:hypothetical protein|nr:hypothetical protein [Rhodococcus erythropolis]